MHSDHKPSFSGEATPRPENLDQEMLGSSPSMTVTGRSFRKLKIAAGSLALLLAAAAAPLLHSAATLPPLDLTAATERSTVVLDREGRLLRPFLTADGRWKLPVGTGDVDPRYLAMLKAYEDRRFDSHAGIDPLGLLRAAGQMLWNGRIVSGGSTLTMQVARLLEPREERSLGAKLRQAVRAVELERRFTKTGESNGVTVIDDYGHHPVEIAAVLKAARTAGTGRTIAVVQPHRYSRLHSLFEDFCACFNDADTVLVADVYAAGEQPIEGADRDGLVEGLRMRGHRQVLPLPSAEALPSMVRDLAQPGDFVVCLGAGNITAWANALPGELDKLHGTEGGKNR